MAEVSLETLEAFEKLFSGLCTRCQAIVHTRLLQYVIPEQGPQAFSPLAKLLEEVAQEHGMTVEAIVKRSNYRQLCDVRKEFAVRARQAGYSYPLIGRILKRHYSTVIHMVKFAK